MKELRDLYNTLDTDADGSLTFNDLTQRAFGEDIQHIISKAKSNMNIDEEEGDINHAQTTSRPSHISEEIDN